MSEEKTQDTEVEDPEVEDPEVADPEVADPEVADPEVEDSESEVAEGGAETSFDEGAEPETSAEDSILSDFSRERSEGTVIMIVEDAKILQATFRMRFQKVGIDVEMVSNGREALDALEVGALPSLIICDLRMPVMDGYDFIEALRSHPEYELIPVIVCSASVDREAVIKALQAGANDYIVKPFTIETVLEKVKKALG
ncbi:MAG: response regulator [Planctomycetota bacterium]|nr:response regulator [Planctomycetota bacterium]